MRLRVLAGAAAFIATMGPAAQDFIRVPPAVQEERLIYRVRPSYPKIAKEARVQGTVRMAVWIDEQGRVKQLKLVSGHPLLVQAAFEAVSQWRYLPATRNGKPVAVLTVVEVTFSLGLRPRPRNLLVA